MGFLANGDSMGRELVEPREDFLHFCIGSGMGGVEGDAEDAAGAEQLETGVESLEGGGGLGDKAAVGPR